MEQPLVSVVIPVYNVAPWLDRCVASVVGQSYENLEILLIDDGSADESAQLCHRWAERDGRIRVVHQANAGLGMARNTGLSLARGAYLFFFDSDDYVDGTIVETCVRSALSYGSDVVLYGLSTVFPDGRRFERPVSADPALYAGRDIQEILLPGLFVYRHGLGISACGKLYRAELLKTHGLRFPSEREVLSEDACFALAVFSKARRASLVGKNPYFYCRRDQSLSRQYQPRRQERNDRFLSTALAIARREGLPEAVSRALMARYQLYTLDAMKQILEAELSNQEKREELWNIFRSPALRRTLDGRVLALHGGKSWLFFRLLKGRCYLLCLLLMQLRAREKRKKP